MPVISANLGTVCSLERLFSYSSLLLKVVDFRSRCFAFRGARVSHLTLQPTDQRRQQKRLISNNPLEKSFKKGGKKTGRIDQSST